MAFGNQLANNVGHASAGALRTKLQSIVTNAQTALDTLLDEAGMAADLKSRVMSTAEAQLLDMAQGIASELPR